VVSAQHQTLRNDEEQIFLDGAVWDGHRRDTMESRRVRRCLVEKWEFDILLCEVITHENAKKEHFIAFSIAFFEKNVSSRMVKFVDDCGLTSSLFLPE